MGRGAGNKKSGGKCEPRPSWGGKNERKRVGEGTKCAQNGGNKGMKEEDERKSKWSGERRKIQKKEKKRGGVYSRMSGVTDGSDSAERDQRTMSQCARTGDNRRGNREGVSG